MKDHWFWWIVMLLVLIWYSTVTIYVAVRGSKDIQGMLKRLKNRNTSGSE